jgi:hypothetical protein
VWVIQSVIFEDNFGKNEKRGKRIKRAAPNKRAALYGSI